MRFVFASQADYAEFLRWLSILGVDGSLAAIGKNVQGKEPIFVKSGVTVSNGQMIALNMAGYIDAKSGRHLDAFNDEADILGIVYARY